MSWVSALIVIDQEERSHYQHSLTMEQWMTPTQGWWLSWSCWWRSSSASLAWSSPAVRSVPRVLPPLSSDQCQSMVTPLHQCCGKLQTVAGVQHFLIRPTLTSPQQQVNKNNPTFYADQGGDARRCRQCYEHVLSVTLWTVDTKDTHLTPPLDSVLPLSFYKWPRAEDIRSINSQDWSMAAGSVSIYYDNSLIKLLCLELWVQ